MEKFNARSLFLFAFLSLLHVVFSVPISTDDLRDDFTTFNITARSLAKRSCAVGADATGGIPICNTFTVDSIVNSMNNYGAVANKDCLFYLGLNGKNGQSQASAWYCAMREQGRGSVVWGTSLPKEFLEQNKRYTNKFSNLQAPDPQDSSKTLSPFRVWASLHSQALAEVCTGVAYFMAPTSNPGNDPLDNIWWNYEFPALTRNPNILSIVKVDPTLRNEDGSFADSGHPIWVKSNPPTEIEPAGNGYSLTLPTE
ncbi:hypothetical protein F5884DRAFT_512668 [Xylogone sp. PMI_703]|nr:hypothetical protein F5884DRAFT_512668 [Xylogone sp. PMI_703]